MNKLILSIGCAFLFAVNSVYAGRSCEEVAPNPSTVMHAMELAGKAKLALENSGAEVALIGRVGQDLSKYQLRYSHVGIVWRDHPEGRWLVVHELNQCGTANSALYNEGLGNFFMDNMFAYETLIMIPNQATQEKLVAELRSPLPLMLHSDAYSMVAFPFSTRYQNSNQWVLELLAASQSGNIVVSNREQAQAFLKLAGYQPTTLNIPTFTRLGGRMFRANIAFDDHPFDRRMAGQIDTVTVDSIERFLKKQMPDLREIQIGLN